MVYFLKSYTLTSIPLLIGHTGLLRDIVSGSGFYEVINIYFSFSFYTTQKCYKQNI